MKRESNSSSFTVFSFTGNTCSHPISRVFRFQFLMVGAVHRGRTLLSAPIAFQPRVISDFPWTVCAISATAGLSTALVPVFAWLMFNDGFYPADHLRFWTEISILFSLAPELHWTFNIPCCFSWQILRKCGPQIL